MTAATGQDGLRTEITANAWGMNMHKTTTLAMLLSYGMLFTACMNEAPFQPTEYVTLASGTDINGTIEIDGVPVTATITQSGMKAYYTFAGTQGQYVGVGANQVSGLSGWVTLYKPDGSSLASANLSNNGAQLDPIALPVSGTYTIKVDPGLAVGSTTLSLSSDLQSPIVLDGASILSTANRPGQNARYTFAGTQGQYVGVGANQVSGLSGWVTLYKPDGSSLVSANLSNNGAQLDPIALPVSGTYTIKVDPGLAIGSTTLSLSSDLQSPVVLDGASILSTVNRPGQNARYTFTGTQGQYVGVGANQVSGLSGWVTLYKPDGSSLVSANLSNNGAQLDPIALPVSGTYTIKVDPGLAIGSTTLSLSSDLQSPIVIDGASLFPALSRPGQNARYTFTGTQGQYLGVGVSEVSGLSGWVTLYKPDGSSLVTANVTNNGAQLDPGALPTTGTYTLKFDPGLSTGNATIHLSADIAGVMSVGGTAPVAIERPGQNARYSFSGLADHTVILSATNLSSGLGGSLSIRTLDGSNLGTVYLPNGSLSISLPTTGTYYVKTDGGLTTGSLTLSLQ